jgi:glycine/D-amino acid oxidase-like deaminating enzyme
MHDGRGDIFVYKYNAESRIVASMFPMGARGRDMAYTRRVLSDRLRWLHPQIKREIRWEFLWFGELDMQKHTIPRLYDLAPGVVGLTGLSGRGVPTGSMLGGILAEWAKGIPEADLSLKLEPLTAAPFFMSFAPTAMLRYYRAADWLRAKTSGVPLPPHA